MDIGSSIALVFLLGFLAGRVLRLPPLKEFKLIMAINLDCTQPIKIKAKGYDRERNEIDLTGTDLKIEAIATEGNFGSVNDALDTFNPGDAGAKGSLKGSITVGEIVYTAEVEIELVPGALSEIALEFTPTEPE